MAGGSGERKLNAEEFKLRLQVETTLLVWVRTSLALMGFGFLIARFGLFLRELANLGKIHVKAHPRAAAVNSACGTGMIVLGVVVLLIAVFNHRRLVVQIERGELALPGRWSLGMVLGLLVAALGTVFAIYLTYIEL